MEQQDERQWLDISEYLWELEKNYIEENKEEN